MFLALAGRSSFSTPDSSFDGGEEFGYVLPSVTGAMYLFVPAITHDLPAGFSRLVYRPFAHHRAPSHNVLHYDRRSHEGANVNLS